MKNVPNHQPVIICCGFNFHMDGSLMMVHHFDNRASSFISAKMQQLRRKPKKHLEIRNKLIPWNRDQLQLSFRPSSIRTQPFSLPGPPLSALSAPPAGPFATTPQRCGTSSLIRSSSVGCSPCCNWENRQRPRCAGALRIAKWCI